ncbi:uncharacterized protein TRIADDRAFT_20168, partial [Trichoplax adhaerens]
GTGFVGRNLATYLIKNDLVSKICLADKVPPEMAWLNDIHKAAISDERVKFKSVNLLNEGTQLSSLEKVFTCEEGEFEFIINCAAATRYGQDNSVYEEGIYRLSLLAAKEVAKHNHHLFIELSTAQVYSSDKKRSNEESKLNPWTGIAKYKLKAEKGLESISGLNYAILRPAIIYGLGDRQSLTPRLIIGAVYKELDEKMKLLWGRDLRLNTVHVHDVCRAIWHVCIHGKKGEVYNLADKGDTTQGFISQCISEIFGIKHDYFNTVMSNLASLGISTISEESNEKHMEPWSKACKRDNITNTPLSPYLDQELLYNKHLYVDGSKIEKSGFTYEYPNLTTESLRMILQDYVRQGLFPKSLSNGN